MLLHRPLVRGFAPHFFELWATQSLYAKTSWLVDIDVDLRGRGDCKLYVSQGSDVDERL